jgi:hypothetical protein
MGEPTVKWIPKSYQTNPQPELKNLNKEVALSNYGVKIGVSRENSKTLTNISNIREKNLLNEPGKVTNSDSHIIKPINTQQRNSVTLNFEDSPHDSVAFVPQNLKIYSNLHDSEQESSLVESSSKEESSLVESSEEKSLEEISTASDHSPTGEVNNSTSRDAKPFEPLKASPEFNALLENVQNQSVKKYRQKGTTATAPIILPALKENAIEAKSSKDVKNVAILKFAAEGDVGMKRRMEKFIKAQPAAQQHLGMQRPTTYLPGADAKAKAFGEVVAFILSEESKTHVVPETRFVYMTKNGDDIELAKPGIEGKELGTIQQFASSDFKDMRVHLNDDIKSRKIVKTNSSTPTSPGNDEFVEKKLTFRAEKDDKIEIGPNENINYTQQGLVRLQLCGISSYKWGQIDCHPGNVLSKKNDKGQYVDFVLIDNGNGFFVDFPKEQDTFILKNYCGWTANPMSSVPLDEEAIKHINDIDMDHEIELMLKTKDELKGLDQLGNADLADVYFQDQMIINSMIRINVLKKIATIRNASLEDVATVKTYKQTEDFLGKDAIAEITNYTRNKIRHIEAEKLMPQQIEPNQTNAETLENVKTRPRRNARTESEFKSALPKPENTNEEAIESIKTRPRRNARTEAEFRKNPST